MQELETGALAMMIPIVGIVLGIGIGFWAIYWDYRTKQLKYRERELMIEKGLTPPPLVPDKTPATPEDCLRRGTIMLFLGIGLGCFTCRQPIHLRRSLIPLAMLVRAILHANNWRDSLSDREKRVATIASLLGDTGSLWYYGFLIFGPTLIVFLLMLGPRFLSGRIMAMPLTFLLVVLALPRALALWGRARRRRNPRQPMDFIILDGATAQYNLTFGLLCTAALWFRFVLDKL